MREHAGRRTVPRSADKTGQSSGPDQPSEAILNRDESATQDEVLYSSYEEGRRLGARAWKVNEHTPGEPLSVTQVTYCVARRGQRLSEVSRERISRRSSECLHGHADNGTGVAADGLPVQRRVREEPPRQRLERCRSRMAAVNESGN